MGQDTDIDGQYAEEVSLYFSVLERRRLYWHWWLQEQMKEYMRDYLESMLSKSDADEPHVVDSG